MRREFVPTDPVSAKAIALRAESTLRLMRECAEKEPLQTYYRGWLAYADSESVCEQIREHVLRAFNETSIMIKAKEKNAEKEKKARVVRDPTGERVE